MKCSLQSLDVGVDETESAYSLSRGAEIDGVLSRCEYLASHRRLSELLPAWSSRPKKEHRYASLVTVLSRHGLNLSILRSRRLISLALVLGGIGQTHLKPCFLQSWQIGFCSPHFFRRFRHMKHPVFVLSLGAGLRLESIVVSLQSEIEF
jgi:hypothetical protein